MALESVLQDVQRDAQNRAKAILDQANQEAKSLLAAAQEKAQALLKARDAESDRDAAMVLRQGESRAESEHRKLLLQAEAQLRNQLRETLLAGFAKLDASTRTGHVNALLKSAEKIISHGSVWGAEADKKALDAQKTYSYAGSTPIVGGIIVEAKDGATRLDLSYETLLGDMWKDVLRSESGLFR